MGPYNSLDPANWTPFYNGHVWTSLDTVTQEMGVQPGVMHCVHCKREKKNSQASFMLNGNTLCEEHFNKMDSLVEDSGLIK